MPTSVRPSACPGLLRIVPALDGGICRVKLPGGVLRSAQARAIAEAARQHASGVLELTNRSNLQIRGVLPGQESTLIDALLGAGLGPRVASADDVRNLLLSPAAGLDPQARMDVRPLANQLLDLLQDTPALHALSPKFALQLDGGEALTIREHPHDLWLAAEDEQYLLLGLAGCPVDAPLARIEATQVVELVRKILLLFLELATPEQSRMRQLLAQIPASELLQRLQTRLDFPLQPVPANWQPAATISRSPAGIYPQAQSGLCMVAAGAQLGRLHAEQLTMLAELSERHGDSELRLTPWQGVLLGNVPESASRELLAALGQLGLLTHIDEPLLGLITCSGSAACARGLADSKHHALHLAELLRESGARPQVHLSACPRSCASARVQPYTLLASTPDHYQLYQRTPEAPGFGRLLAPAMTIDEAGAWFARQHPAGTPDA
ncbi:precorrin-3B synthase [Ectopseudomonas guguanensis]|uniref:precorrin-3B synthase n=1 Tax=Ectopseudomonas guguanensis TaxID=1198456 RepID=UPI000BC2D44C|nr:MULTISPECIES: precorrin-3B synthase [Pseudomonas]ATH79932.1 precorrin-3B synthase [Pseudomonas mendocina]MDR8016797.1 precorrin-3B synthase [Pseudomonas guguanensis]UTH36497.1 precorrin-3B synthase [Pseudomonas sp. KHPS1]UZZ10848.1 precorrin-3B synthase [Pseudomonas mendocina]